MILTFIFLAISILSLSYDSQSFVPLLLSPARKNISSSEAMWSLAKLVCKLSDQRYNLYVDDDDVDFHSVFFDTVADDCMKPVVIFG